MCGLAEPTRALRILIDDRGGSMSPILPGKGCFAESGKDAAPGAAAYTAKSASWNGQSAGSGGDAPATAMQVQLTCVAE